MRIVVNQLYYFENETNEAFISVNMLAVKVIEYLNFDT